MNHLLFLGAIFEMACLCGGLRILFVLPCYGGHFGTMTPLVATMADTHDVTVLETSPACRAKLAPLQRLASFKVIEKDLTFQEIDFGSFIQTSIAIFQESPRFLEKLYRGITEFLETNRGNYDVMIVDGTQEGTLIAAEVANIPTAVIMSGLPGPIENVLEKLNSSLAESFFPKILQSFGYIQLFDKFRRENSLPAINSLGRFYGFEYPCRFPALMMMSPMFYPDPHPSATTLFIGASRRGSESGSLSDELTNWLDRSAKKVVYLSLGTHVTLEEKVISEFVGKVRGQQNYRLVWTLPKSMAATVDRLGLATDDVIFFSGYLSQYSLLGHEKVKVFVTHAGLGSTIDLVKRRKPSVCVPQLFDQFYNCRKLSNLAIAEEVTTAFEFKAVNEAIQKVFLNYDTYAKNADKFAKHLESYEEKEHVEKFLETLAAKKQLNFIKELEFDFASQRFYSAWLILKLCFILSLVGFLGGIFLTIKFCCRSKSARRPKSKKS